MNIRITILYILAAIKYLQRFDEKIRLSFPMTDLHVV
jgi:hypothetical protein